MHDHTAASFQSRPVAVRLLKKVIKWRAGQTTRAHTLTHAHWSRDTIDTYSIYGFLCSESNRDHEHWAVLYGTYTYPRLINVLVGRMLVVNELAEVN